MPESVEVFNITNWLNNNCKNKIINDITFLNYKTTQKYQDEIKNYLPLMVKRVYCKAKHIIWVCRSLNNKEKKIKNVKNVKNAKNVNIVESEIYFHNHLGMTGRWSLDESKHNRILFTFDQNFPVLSNKLYFEDTRKFGKFDICLNKTDLDDKLKSVGCDLLKISLEYYKNKNEKIIKSTQLKWLNHFNNIKSKTRPANRNIYNVLMDQKHFSGLGNYLTSDVLYGSKINPNRKISDLTSNEIILLFNKSMEILYRSYLSGGLTIKDYWDPDNNKGTYKCLVYGKSMDNLGNKIIKTKISARTCHWVPIIQK